MTRKSDAGLAIITRIGESGHTEYLSLWNANWNAYSLIGGHVEQGETFLEACLREIVEEVESEVAEVAVAPYPYATLQFREYSRAAKTDTDYHWQVFVARLADDVYDRLPANCQWISADQIRAGRAADGQPIAGQAKRVLKAVDDAEFDLFVSYGHSDDLDGSVTALVEHVRREQEAFVPNEPLKIFFDIWGIRNGDDWQRRIYNGLIESKSMLAVLSPAYFASEWCRREYEAFVAEQTKKLYPGEPIHAIYIHSQPEFDETTDHPQRAWFDDLKRRQFLDAKPWWPDGHLALQQDVVVSRLRELRQCIWDRVCDARAIQSSPTNLRDFNPNFVGREHELTQLWNKLRMDHAVAVSAIQGVGGLGKTALALAYAHSRRRDYPGGQFQIGMENVATADGLKFEVINLANNWLGAAIPDELINANLNAAFAKARSVFERPGQGKILLILDNVATDGVLSDRSQCLPSSEHVHVLATTRLNPELWGIDSLKLESLSTADSLDLFLKYRPFDLPDESQWHQARSQVNGPSDLGQPQAADTEEWKAAVGIVNRLGGHALAVEVVAVFLGNNRSIKLQDYLNGLIAKGTSLKLDQAGDDEKVRARLSQAIETNIATLLEPTFAKLEAEHPLAMRALEWAALIPPEHVPWIWLKELLAEDFADQLQHDADDPGPWQDSVVPLLQGWQLLTGTDDQPTARMHRIVQSIVAARVKENPATNNDSPSGPGPIRRLLSYCTRRSEVMKQNWGQPGINWELTPIFEAAKTLLPLKGLEVALLVDRLIIPLRQDGRLLPAISLQQQVIDLELSRLATTPEDANYARDLSLSYVRMGDLLMALGNCTLALECHKKALELREQLTERSPENLDHARDLSISYNELGQLLCSLGNVRKALPLYQKALVVQERLLNMEPTNFDYARYLWLSYSTMGDLFFNLGDCARAREVYEDALEVSEQLVKRAPENTECTLDLSMSYGNVGKLFVALGNDVQALEFYKKSLEVSQRLVNNAPGNADYARHLAITYSRLGKLWGVLGDAAQKHDYYKKALEVRQRLVEKAPDTADYLRDLSMSYSNMGDLFDVSSHGVLARKHYQKALEVGERLTKNSPARADYARELSVTCNKIGDLYRVLGNGLQARANYKKALRIREQLAERSPENVSYARDLSVSYYNMATICSEESQPDVAISWWRRAHDILQGMVDRGLHVSPDDRIVLAELKEKLGEES